MATPQQIAKMRRQSLARARQAKKTKRTQQLVVQRAPQKTAQQIKRQKMLQNLARARQARKAKRAPQARTQQRVQTRTQQIVVQRAPQKTAQQMKRQKMLQNLARARQARKAKRMGGVQVRVQSVAQQMKTVQKTAQQMKRQKMLQNLARARQARKAKRMGRVQATLQRVQQKVAQRAQQKPAQKMTQRPARRRSMKKQAQKAPTQMRKQQKSAPKAASSGGVRLSYRLIPGRQGVDKFPYYLSPGYTARVGGGATGPGVIRVVTGSGATPFSRLSKDRQYEIIRFLNSDNGSDLRSEGAKRKIVAQQIMAAIKTTKTGPGIKKKQTG